MSYPWIPIGVGDGWQAYNAIAGHKGPLRRTCREALLDCAELHELNGALGAAQPVLHFQYSSLLF